MSGPRISVSTQIGGKTKRIGRRKFISAYLITINTNKRPQSMVLMEHFNNTFKGHLDELFETADHYKDGNLVVYNNDPDGHTKVESIDAKTRIEIGEDPRGGRIHSHTVLKIIHRTSIFKIDGKFIREWFRQKMGLNVYINIKLIPANVEAAEIYVDKTLDEQQDLRDTPAEPIINELNSQ